MLELFAVRGQLAVSILVHASLAATTWTASLLAVEAARRASGAPDWLGTADDARARVRVLAPITAVSGLLVVAQLGIFWRAAFEVGGATLGLPLAVAVAASVVRAIVVRRASHPSAVTDYGVVGLGTLSGTAALAALAWLAHPAGADIIAEGQLTASPLAAFWASSGWMRVLHTGLAAVTLGGALLAGGAMRRGHGSMGQLALRAAFLATTLQAVVGVATTRSVAHHEPVKVAAMAAQWNDRTRAPFQLGAWPYDFGEQTRPGVQIPSAMSLLIHGDADAPVEGLLATHMENRPPVAGVYLVTQVKLVAGLLAWVALLVATLRARGPVLPRRLVGWFIVPTTFVTWTLGWLVAELGRSPWTIRGALRVGLATWTPYGMAPTALLWTAAAIGLAVVAGVRCRRLTGPAAAEPS